MGESSSSCRTARTGPREDPNDWKIKFPPIIRRNIVDQILSASKISFDPDAWIGGPEIVEKFEENTFRNARTKDDYIRTINRRLSSIYHKSGHQTVGVSSSNPGQLPQNSVVAQDGQSIDMINVCEASSGIGGDSVRQGLQSNIPANNQRHILCTQSPQKVVYQRHQQQESQLFLNHKVHQPNIDGIHVGDIHNNHHPQQQPIESQSNPFCSQNQALPTESRLPPLTEQPGTAVFQQNQLVSQEANKQLFPFWKTMPNSFQQAVGLQSNDSCLQQQYRMISPQLKAVNLKSHERSLKDFQVEDTSSLPKLGQRGQSVNNFHQLLDSTYQRTCQRPETLTSMLAPHNVTDQRKVLPSQKGLAEVSSALSPASLESASASEQANMAELHDQVYEKFQSMKKEYLPLLTYFYNILNEKYKKLPMTEVGGKYKKRIIAADKFIKILTMPRGNLLLFSMENLESLQHTVKLFLNSFKPENSVSIQPCEGPSRISQLQQHINGGCKFPPMNLGLTSNHVGPSPLSSTQQVFLCSQPNTKNSPCSASLIKLEQQTAPSSLDYAARTKGLVIAGTQQKKFCHDTSVKSFESATISLQQNYILSTSPQQKQLKHPMTQPQNVKQCFQPQLIQQHMRLANTQPLPKTPRHFQSTSPQMSQHSSAQVDQQKLSLPLSKAGTPLHSASSSSVTSYPSTPFAPFSLPADYNKHPSGSSSQIIPEDSGQSQPIFDLTAVDTGNEVQTQSLPVTSPGIAASLLCTEFACPNKNHQSSATKNPLERLIKSVQPLSPKALSNSVSEIGSAMKLLDGIAGTACNDYEADVDENLHGRNSTSQYRGSFEEKMKRKLHSTSAMAPDALSFSISQSDNLKQSNGQPSDPASSESSTMKRRRIEPSNALLDEIKYINQRLLQTVVDVDSTEDVSTSDHGEGTIVRCIHNAVALSENFKMQYASLLSVLPLRLLVPASYPDSSPVILDGYTSDCSGESKEESFNFSEKTRSRFSLSLCKLSKPMSLADIAMTWDDCARTVLNEYAQSLGGGCFSSRYGKWENCLTA